MGGGNKGRAPLRFLRLLPQYHITNSYNPCTRKSHSYIKETYLRYVIDIHIVQIVEIIYFINLKIIEDIFYCIEQSIYLSICLIFISFKLPYFMIDIHRTYRCINYLNAIIYP